MKPDDLVSELLSYCRLPSSFRLDLAIPQLHCLMHSTAPCPTNRSILLAGIDLALFAASSFVHASGNDLSRCLVMVQGGLHWFDVQSLTSERTHVPY